MPEEQEHLQSDEDMEAILRLAVRRSPFDDDLRSRLRQTADELGITPEQLAAAEAEYALKKKQDETTRAEREAYETDFAAFRKSRWNGLYQSIGSYISINLLLHAINYATTGGTMIQAGGRFAHYWAIWPLIGMAFPLFGRFVRVVFASREEEEAKFRKWRIKNGVLARVEAFVKPKQQD
ncbi:MAG: 2TM domain-containing protein [Armatimonadetes bacterium]|nr:2TM domain-containing protein [Armatimonadota bacterium]